MKLFLIRHCEGEANKNNLVSGDSNDSLSSTGVRQANNLHDFIRKIDLKPSKIISSNWKRAVQTAEIVFPNQEILKNKNLGETDSGHAAVLTNDVFSFQNPSFYQSRENKFPGGESHLEMFRRTSLFIDEELRSQSAIENLVLISHAGPITSIMQHLLNIPIERFPLFIPLHGSISQLQISDKSNLERLIFFSLVPGIEQIKKCIEYELKWP